MLVAKAHEETANIRNDFQHKLPRRLIDETRAMSCVETLNVKNMLEDQKSTKHIAYTAWRKPVAS